MSLPQRSATSWRSSTMIPPLSNSKNELSNLEKTQYSTCQATNKNVVYCTVYDVYWWTAATALDGFWVHSRFVAVVLEAEWLNFPPGLPSKHGTSANLFLKTVKTVTVELPGHRASFPSTSPCEITPFTQHRKHCSNHLALCWIT